MDRENVKTALEGVFAKVFGRKIEIFDAMTANDVEGWDSMTNIRLLDAVEREFGVRLSVSEVMGLGSVGSLIDLVHGKKA
ncbi:MAG TPA: acyl carrier protein [Polyangiaceae bacterium]